VLWLCSTEFPSLGLSWASLVDQTGTYGLTKVKCTPVTFGGGTSGRPFSLWRSLARIWEIFGL